SALFRRLPTEPLEVAGDGIEWAWVDSERFATTEPECDGATRMPFAAGYLPAEHQGCGWDRLREWFRGDGRTTRADEASERVRRRERAAEDARRRRGWPGWD